METYNVQCLAGHVFTAKPRSELEGRCIARERRGLLDALPVHPSECPECSERSAMDNAILSDADAVDAYMSDARHPNAVNRYLRGDCLD